MLRLNDGDKEFIKLIEAGTKPSPAFREAYPEHETVVFWNMTERGSQEHQRAAELLKQAAQNKLVAKYIKNALSTYQEKMEEYSALSLEAATELVKSARSEKVRADLAIEGIRHKVGTPTQKIAIQEEKTVYLTFGDKPKDRTDVIEGEVV